MGSHFYVQKLTKEQVAATDAMVNMDTLGLGPTLVWGSHSDQFLVGALGYIAKRWHAPVSIVDVDEVGSTNSEQVAVRKIPHYGSFIDAETVGCRIIHSSNDRIAAVRLDDYYQTYGLLAAYLAIWRS